MTWDLSGSEQWKMNSYRCSWCGRHGTTVCLFGNVIVHRLSIDFRHLCVGFFLIFRLVENTLHLHLFRFVDLSHVSSRSILCVLIAIGTARWLHIIRWEYSDSISDAASPPVTILFNNFDMFTHLEYKIASFIRFVRIASNVAVRFAVVWVLLVWCRYCLCDLFGDFLNFSENLQRKEKCEEIRQH